MLCSDCLNLLTEQIIIIIIIDTSSPWVVTSEVEVSKTSITTAIQILLIHHHQNERLRKILHACIGSRKVVVSAAILVTTWRDNKAARCVVDRLVYGQPIYSTGTYRSPSQQANRRGYRIDQLDRHNARLFCPVILPYLMRSGARISEVKISGLFHYPVRFVSRCESYYRINKFKEIKT